MIGNTYNVDSTIVPAAGGARVANPNYDGDNSSKKRYRISHSIKIFR